MERKIKKTKDIKIPFHISLPISRIKRTAEFIQLLIDIVRRLQSKMISFKQNDTNEMN